MKKTLIWASILFLAGCVTVKIPKYLQEDFPYQRDFTADFDQTFNAATLALNELGWKITETTSPTLMDPQTDKRKEVLIFTEIRQTPLFLVSSYSTLNAYLREIDKQHTQVEIRYVSVLSLPFKNISNYQDDSLVNKILSRIEAKLN